MRKEYQVTKPSQWKGRITREEDGIQYYYQAIEIVDVHESIESDGNQIALLGYACEEGVRRNQGRIGSFDGPKSFRAKLSKLAFHHSDIKLLDAGDVSCVNGALEVCQNTFAAVTSSLIQKKIFPIAIGGGHDIAYGHFKGIYNAIKDSDKHKIGVINFDAHFDLRPIESKPNSGTPFKQILDKYESAEYFVIGIQKSSNPKSLFEIADEKGVGYILNHDAVLQKLAEVKAKLSPFLERNDYLYISIDLDGFTSAVAPGVSAPSPLGFSPFFVQEVLSFLFQSGKVISCDLAELNPRFDVDGLTAKLTAILVDFIIGKQKAIISK
ncbi:formimidoylglutamase [Portibacter lacus]|uniref:Formimidoylglutamase n=1 Tax=Portibacter lacus TaxID=1099794 RepID=A0AA37SSS6_9BACT|nr:formimidoylglutamase [Portibacter lacus]GLR19104.1 formimidoylglutamase [Portibacter lacus]